MIFARAFFLLFALSISALAIAENKRTASIWNGTEIRFGIGILKGESSSVHYDDDGSTYGFPGYKFGESDLKLDSVIMTGIGATVDAGESMRIYLDYWVNSADGDGSMDDYMWTFTGYDWSDRTEHPDTTVKRAELIDISAEYIFADTGDRREVNSWAAIVGYRQDFFDWRIRGGSGITSNPGYRDSPVLISDLPLYTYQQTFTVPYVGVQYNTVKHTRDGKLRSRFYLHYSPLASGVDEFVSIRGFRVTETGPWKYEEEGSGGSWYRFGLEMEFEITKRIMLNLNYSLQQYDEIKGTRRETNLTSGVTTSYSGDSAGMSSKTNMFSIGMSYRF